MTNKLVLILGIFFVGSLGKELCGPESCSDLKLVKSCHNVNDCIENVWSKLKPTGVRDDVCDICMKMVTEARDELQSNQTREELKEVLEGSCKLLMLKPAVRICMKLADEFAPELVAILSSQMDPETVCTVAKLCNNAELRAALKESHCSSCQKFGSFMTAFMNGISEPKFKDEVLRACRSMGSYSDACFYYASTYSKLLYNETKFSLSQKPCEVLDLCPKGYEVTKEDGMEKGNLPWILAQKRLCVLCPEISATISGKVKSFRDREEFRQKAVEICEKLTISRDDCKREVDRYASTIYYWMSQDVDVSFLCSSFMCRSAKDSEYPVWPLLPASSPETKPLAKVSVQSESKNVRVLKKNRVKLSEGDQVVDVSMYALPLNRFAFPLDEEDRTICWGVFNAMSGNSNEPNYVKEVLTPVCSDMDDTEDCRDFLNSYVYSLSSIFSNREIPDMICRDVWKYKYNSSGPICNVCVKAFRVLSEGLKNETFKEKFSSSIGKVCDTMGGDSKTMCRSFMDTFMEKTLSSLAAGNETKTCTFLKFCEVNSVVIPPLEPEVEGKSCGMCLMVAETVIDELTDKRNEDEIKRLLLSVCSKIPKSFEQTCDEIVEQYSQELIDMIARGLNANEICAKLGFCRSYDEDMDEHQAPINPKQAVAKSKAVCDICLTGIKMVLNWLQENRTEEAIRHYINQMCDYLPEETRDTCQNLIEQYADDIVDMIVADFNETEVCIFLKLCGPKKLEKTSSSSAPLKTFDVGTNEVRDAYSREGVCEFCKKVENAMSSEGNEENAAETLMALLMEICILNVGNLNLGCEKMVSEKVLPYGRGVIMSMNNTCETFNLCPSEVKKEEIDKKLLSQIHAAVQECAMCEAIVEIISSHESMLNKHYNFAKNASLICLSVPKNKESQCESMVVSYGPSIVNLLVDMNVEPNDVCFFLKLCDESQQTKIDMPVTDVEQGGIRTRPDLEDCKKGPSYWCSSAENAKKCGTFPHCQQIVWKDGVPPK